MPAIRVFCEVARQKSFARAAAQMNLTSSAISQRVKQLEDFVGCRLLERKRHNITTTEEGKFLFEKFERALSNIDYSINCVVSGQLAQRVVLGALASFTSKWLIPRLHRFYQMHPNVQLITRSVNHTIDVERESAELAVVNLPAPPASGALRSQLLWRENLFVVCSPRYLNNNPHPLKTVGDLHQHTLLHDQTEIASKRHLDWTSWMRIAAPGKRLSMDKSRVFTQSDLTLQAAIEGHGVALARSSLASDDLQKGLLVDPLGIRVPVQSGCYLCARKNAWDLPKIAILRDWLMDEAQRDRLLMVH